MWFVLTFYLVKVSFTRTIAPTAAANCRKFTARQTPLIRIIKIYSQFVQKTMDASHRFNTSRFVDSCALCSLCCQIIPFRTIVICLPSFVPPPFPAKIPLISSLAGKFPRKTHKRPDRRCRPDRFFVHTANHSVPKRTFPVYSRRTRLPMAADQLCRHRGV